MCRSSRYSGIKITFNVTNCPGFQERNWSVCPREAENVLLKQTDRCQTESEVYLGSNLVNFYVKLGIDCTGPIYSVRLPSRSEKTAARNLRPKPRTKYSLLQRERILTHQVCCLPQQLMSRASRLNAPIDCYRLRE